MKNIIIGGVIIIIVAGIAVFSLSRLSQPHGMQQYIVKIQDEPAVENAEGVSHTDSMEAEDTTMRADSRYVPYTKEALEATSDTRRVLFFYANWCPTCRPVDENLENSKVTLPEDVKVIRVNYNDTETDQEEKDLAKKYGVTYQHTFVQIDSQGNEVTKWNGGDVTQLLENIQ